MYFNYSDSVYVSEADFERMIGYMKKGHSSQFALNVWACGLEDEYFFNIGKVEWDIIAELERRFKENDKNRVV